jgi:hypothetical protein
LSIANWRLALELPGPTFESWQLASDNAWRGAGVVELAALEML